MVASRFSQRSIRRHFFLDIFLAAAYTGAFKARPALD